MATPFAPRNRLAHPTPLRLVNHPTIIYLTVCVANRRPLLATPQAHTLLREAWIRATRCPVGRYVVMPDHVHLFCGAGDPALKFSKWVEYWRNDITRAWSVAAEKPIWQRDYFDRQLRNNENYGEKWEYIRQNPVRAGLVESADAWPFQGEINVLPW